MSAAARTERDNGDIDDFLHRLADEHRSADMRVASIRVAHTDIQLWATDELRLSSGAYRVTWRYEDRGKETVIVCFTLAEM